MFESCRAHQLKASRLRGFRPTAREVSPVLSVGRSNDRRLQGGTVVVLRYGPVQSRRSARADRQVQSSPRRQRAMNACATTRSCGRAQDRRRRLGRTAPPKLEAPKYPGRPLASPGYPFPLLGGDGWPARPRGRAVTGADFAYTVEVESYRARVGVRRRWPRWRCGSRLSFDARMQSGR